MDKKRPTEGTNDELINHVLTGRYKRKRAITVLIALRKNTNNVY